MKHIWCHTSNRLEKTLQIKTRGAGPHCSPEQQKLIKSALQCQIQNMFTDKYCTVDLAQNVNKFFNFYPHIFTVDAIYVYHKCKAPLAVSV